jgi:putative DNA primase/helicase
MTPAVEQFCSAIRAAGLSPPDSLEPGRFHRVPGYGKRKGNSAGWCKLFPDGRGGVFGDFASGLTESWQAESTRPQTSAERNAFLRSVEEAKATAQAKRKAEHDAAARSAARLWTEATDAPKDHGYLIRKGVLPHGVRVYRGNLSLHEMPCDGAMLVPIRNAAGELRSLQFIAAEKCNEGGDKRYVYSGERIGCYHAIGKPNGVICLVEGYATGASVHEATGHAVAVAFDAGNLKDVALALRAKYPELQIIVCADDDYRTAGNPGIVKATQAASAVGGLVAIPDFGADRPDSATDFNDLASHRGVGAVERAIANAKAPDMAIPQPESQNAIATDLGLRVLTLDEFLAETIPPREEILAPWLLTQSLSMLHSWRGVGKTFMGLNIAYAVATGGEFLSWKAPKPRKALYIDGEMAAAALQERFKGIVLADERDFDPEYLRIVTPDLQPGPMPDLATDEGQTAIEEIVGDAELIIVDNISTLVRRAGRENDAESWNDVGTWALRMRQRGRSVLFLHHSGKGGTQRGSSKKEDTLDAVVCLKHPADYSPEQGARFEVHFEKARNGGGQELKPFEATLGTDSAGKPIWTFKSVEESTFHRVVSLAVEGLSQKDIAEELEINKSNVSRHLRKAREMGMLPREDK